MSPVQMSRTNPLDYVCPCLAHTHIDSVSSSQLSRLYSCSLALFLLLLSGIFDARILQDNARSLAPPTAVVGVASAAKRFDFCVCFTFVLSINFCQRQPQTHTLAQTERERKRVRAEKLLQGERAEQSTVELCAWSVRGVRRRGLCRRLVGDCCIPTSHLLQS